MITDLPKLPHPSLPVLSSLRGCCCTLSLPLPQDNFLISHHDSSSMETPNYLLPHTGFPFWSKPSVFPYPLHPAQHSTGQNHMTISNFQAAPPLCCSPLPERAQVVPGGNDCYLQDTLHITSTPFGVFRPSSFCCISHFTPWSRALKDQGLLLTGGSTQGTGDTFSLPGTSLKTLWCNSSDNKNVQVTFGVKDAPGLSTYLGTASKEKVI